MNDDPISRAFCDGAYAVANAYDIDEQKADYVIRQAFDSADYASQPTGEMPGREGLGSLDYRVSWPRPATPCDLVPLWKGEFRDFGDWVNFATKRLTGTTGSQGHEVKAICVDALGRRCSIGADFMRARDEDAFPVRYFWECTRTAASLQEDEVGRG